MYNITNLEVTNGKKVVNHVFVREKEVEKLHKRLFRGYEGISKPVKTFQLQNHWKGTHLRGALCCQ